MGIPGLAVGNFSWDWIYEEWIREYPEITSIVDELFLDYQKADMLLQLPFSPDDWRSFRRKKNVPLIGRRSQREREETLKVLNLPEDKPLVLLSFGGMGLQSAQLSGLEELKDFQFISVGSYGAPGTSFSSEYLKQEGIKYQDLVRAADVVATKPGYGIVSECLANRTRILYTSRGEFREYPVLESAMKNQLAVKYIDPSRFRIGSWKAELIELMSLDPPDLPIDVSGAEQAARIILQAIH